MKSGIYKITNIIDGRVYIGKSINMPSRKTQHFSKLKLNKHVNSLLQNAFNKWGGDLTFKFTVIEYCPEDQLNEWEIFYINAYKSTNIKYGYNIDEGGNNGWKHTVYAEPCNSCINRTECGQIYHKWLAQVYCPYYIEE